VSTRRSGLRGALALSLALALSALACKAKPGASGEPTVRALRFAGVDLDYALERIATEAGWVIGLDEILPQDQSPDLALSRVDIDLPAGTLDETMKHLRAAVGGFDYSLENGVLYVRSNLLVKTKTALDEPMMDAGTFQGDLSALGKYIMGKHPSSFITVAYVAGGFHGPAAKFDIPAKSSVRDVLLAYARESKSGWAIRRAGQFSRDTQGQPAIIGTTIEPIAPRTGTSRLPAVYNQLSGTSALADATARLKQPFLVYDRSVVFDTRGILNLVLQRDPGLPLTDTLNDLSQSGFGPANWHFHWAAENGVPVVRTDHFLYYLRGRDLISAELLSGDFEGSLPELARWINTHLRHPAGDVLMGGEIADDMPKGKLHVDSGETVHQALLAFAKASGVSPYVVVLDMQNPFSGQLVEHPRVWRGAYLQDLAEWHTRPEDEEALGIVNPPPRPKTN
jgi:hypothetical protein